MVQFKLIGINDPDFARARGLRWEYIFKPIGLPPGSELCPQDKEGIHLIALEKKEVIGAVLFSPESENSGTLVQMAMCEKQDHQGFSRKLLHELEHRLVKKGFRELKCLIDDANLSYYLKLGFHKMSIEPELKNGVLFHPLVKQLNE